MQKNEMILPAVLNPWASHTLYEVTGVSLKKGNSYVQPSVFDMLAGAGPASAMDGWAE
jgi:hypothetical protein